MSNQYSKDDIYYKTDGICVICGNPVSYNPTKWSLEHYIPRAVYKWIPNAGLTKKLESNINLFIVHPFCNTLKDSSLPTTHSISMMHAPLAVIKQVDNLYNEVRHFIYRYKDLKTTIWQQQNKQCFFCKKTLTFNQAILRRKHDTQPRTPNNAMCLCSRCSRDLGTAKQLIVEVQVMKKEKANPTLD